MKKIAHALVERAREVSPQALALATAAASAKRVRTEAHPLGMLAAYFWLEQRCVRAHIWTGATAGFRDEFGICHDHIWALESHILRGQLEQDVFDVSLTDRGTEIWLRDYDRGTLVRGKGYARLTRVRSERFKVGDSYQLLPGVVHSTAAAVGTVTLVSAVPSARRVARIFGTRLPASPRSAARASVDPANVLSELTKHE